MNLPFHPDIVVVDDDLPALGAIARSLEHPDLRVHAFSDPARALQFVGTREVAVIVSDYRMPAMTGTELLERAAALQPQAARILLTGYSDFQTSLDAINKGSVARLLSKPWEDDELAATIRDLAAGSILERVLTHLAPFQAGLLGLPSAEEMLDALRRLLADDLQLEVRESVDSDGRPPLEDDAVVAAGGGRRLVIPLTNAHREVFRSSGTRRRLR
ncbi:MAG TPA: response regulator, partial [Spirochaetia bacterium]|nr:response regulator [Spirochaetia bacterium]